MIKATIWIVKLMFKEDLFCSRRACPWRITDWTCPVQVFEAPTYHNLKKVKGVQVQACIIIFSTINCYHPNPHLERTLWCVSSPSSSLSTLSSPSSSPPSPSCSSTSSTDSLLPRSGPVASWLAELAAVQESECTIMLQVSPSRSP